MTICPRKNAFQLHLEICRADQEPSYCGLITVHYIGDQFKVDIKCPSDSIITTKSYDWLHDCVYCKNTWIIKMTDSMFRVYQNSGDEARIEIPLDEFQLSECKETWDSEKLTEWKITITEDTEEPCNATVNYKAQSRS